MLKEATDENWNLEIPKDYGTEMLREPREEYDPTSSVAPHVLMKQITDVPQNVILRKPNEIYEFMKDKTMLDREYLWALYVDENMKLIAMENISKGTIEGCPAHAREILKGVYLIKPFGLILVHNHPGGTNEPSEGDVAINSKMLLITKFAEVNFIDSMVISQGGYFSFRANGYFNVSDKLLVMLASISKADFGTNEERDACNIAFRAALETLEGYCNFSPGGGSSE